jgi:dolichol kinase
MSRFRTEIRRKYIHLIGLTVPVIYGLVGMGWGWRLGQDVTLLFTAFFLLLFIAFEPYRIKHGIPVKKAADMAKPLMRPQEKRGIGGHIFFATGAFIAVLVYPHEIAIAILLISTLADGGAAVVGLRWGKHKLIGKKTIEGSLTLFLIALVLAALLVKPLLAAFLGAIVAVFVELLPINDNLTIPVVAGLTMYAVRYFS